ncbi:MAG: hypothetical protein UX13_C0007G0016 [Candidatus Woesebacteria bacterium GW2011_GWB1_45_5]|uniref:Uncharacterized protein n=1 Tax=Candidatus Woesebacteria bacterium GW2011_GWB1_45_5 TaxID=1618581 RepID=A0A0G1MR91_9BACT|nr:MAG: hypothetical protein UX13_C0007G0016 [Candidatus Woesebacteria bacterium GW2011_GWB1_45_5]
MNVALAFNVKKRAAVGKGSFKNISLNQILVKNFNNALVNHQFRSG